MSTLAAEFTAKTARTPAVLRITRIDAGRRALVSEHTVAGKAEARKVAADHGATPWNF